MSTGSTRRQPYPFQGCQWSRRADSTRDYYITPECLEAWNVTEGILLLSHPDGEFLVGFPVARERLWFTPCPVALPDGDYERAGLTYKVELSETSDGMVLFELFSAVGATYVEVGRTPS